MEPKHNFDPSALDKGAGFRKEIWTKKSFSTERLDRAQTLLRSALEKHGEETLTKKNFDKVMEHMHKDPGFHKLYSAGPELEGLLKSHLGIPANEND